MSDLAAVCEPSAVIDAQALRRNLNLLRSRLQPGTRVLAVVKADGYGHGAVLVARVLALAGADWFGVATVEEGVELRAAGVRQPILVLSPPHGTCLVEAAAAGLSVALVDVEHLRELESLPLRQPLRVHLKVDTGMGRLGTDVERLPELLTALGAAKQVEIEGVFSHFGDAERVDSPYCREQCERFARAVTLVRQRWPQCLAHLANSAATWNAPDCHFDMVRPGLLLYGVPPGTKAGTAEFHPVMQLTAPVIQVRELPPGRAVSYGQTFVTTRPTRVAVLRIGYADGYDRRLSNTGFVVLHGTRAPVIGRVCMDVTMVDATNIPTVAVGDRALLWGRRADDVLPLEHVAGAAGTIAYEFLVRLGKRVQRQIVEGMSQPEREEYRSAANAGDDW